ncbi:PREDICTED: C-type lectin 37Da-like isoform X2 [Nicrophorus vespilloides]|uniref:C-type lectin 37Da-like isoform X2 n=1 Tax=Nicrophorus vespilloides TaxID=110193 RepID=A0ABM1M993_NICVS|nr:PREDICTED: C-type lectin 37Da-like isoform X2 [Nicrophorus vespilloides]
MIPSKLATLFSLIVYLQYSHCCEINVVEENTDVCVKTPLNIPVITTYGNKTYYLEVNNQINWHNAYLACKQYNMELINIDSDAEFDYIREFINSLTTAQKLNFWTSGNDLGTEGEYKWMSNGRRVFSNRWHKGQPDNYGGLEDCIHFWHVSNVYLLNDSTCASNMAFICQSIKKPCSVQRSWQC